MWRRRLPPGADQAPLIDLEAILADEVTFRAWYDEAAPRVYAYVFGRTGSISVAEEITQETFLQVVRNPRTFDGRSDTVPWLIGIARHGIARYFRRVRQDQDRARGLVQEIRLVGQGDRGGPTLEDRDEVARAMQAMSQHQRAVLMFRFVDDLSVKDVARLIGRSEDATESLIRRARESFETAIQEGRHAS